MEVDVELTPREEVPAWLTYGTPVFTVLGALLVGSVALLSLDVNPLAAYETMFVQTLTSEFGVSETLIRAVPLILAGLAVYLPMKADLWNIGAEGQLYMGAIVGTWIGLNVSLPAVALVPLMLAGAALGGAVWAGIPAWLRAKWGINEIITTLLFTFIAADIKNYLVRGPMQGGFGGFAQTDTLPGVAQLPAIPGTNVHSGLLVALLAVGAVGLLLNRTRFGFEITFVGSNSEAAEQAGMSRYKVYLFVLAAGGAFAALGGIGEIAGNQARLRAFFAPGYGYTAIPIALLGRNGVLQMTLAALFFALLFVGGDNMSVALGVPAALIDIIQALVILFLITAEFVKRYSVDVSLKRGRPVPGAEVATDG